MAAHHEMTHAARIPVSRIRVHPRNIRSKLTRIESLARSIRAEGIVQPLVVHRKFRRQTGVQDLELIAGHRRLAAAELAGLTAVPCIVLPQHTDDEAMLAMLAENTQRSAVPPADLGRAIRELRTEFNYSTEAIADRLGVPVPEVEAWGNGAGQSAPQEPRAVAARRPQAPQQARPQPVARQAIQRPTITPKRIYDLLAEHETGDVDLAARLRGMLAGWEPAEPAIRGKDSEREADWAEVQQLLDGTRRATDAHAATVRAAVQKLDDGERSAAQIAMRLGISSRQVVRYRAKEEAS